MTDSRASRRSVLCTLGVSGTGLAGVGLPLVAETGGREGGDVLTGSGPIDAGRVLAQSDRDVPDVGRVISRLVDRLDEVVADETARFDGSLPPGVTSLLAGRGAETFVPPTSATLDLRAIDLDYRVVLAFPGLEFGPAGDCPTPSPVPGLFLSGLGVGIDQYVDTPAVDWRTTYATKPWFGVDPLGCVYSGTQVSVDLPPPDGPRTILPNLDAVGEGGCRVQCPEDPLDPVAATLEEFVDAAVNFMSALLRELVELLEDTWAGLGPAGRVTLVLILALLVLSATTSFSVVALVGSILTGGTALVPVVGVTAVAVLLAAATLATPEMPGASTVLG